MKNGYKKILAMNDVLLDEGMANHLIPYLIMEENVTDHKYQLLFGEMATEKKMIYFYFVKYDEYINAIKLFAEEMETKDTEGWVILIHEEDKQKADEVLAKYPNQFKYFEPLERRFFNLLSVGELVKVLLSEQLKSSSLKIVQDLLKQKGIVYSKQDIQQMRLHAKEEKLEPNIFFERAIRIIFIAAVFIFVWLFLAGR